MKSRFHTKYKKSTYCHFNLDKMIKLLFLHMIKFPSINSNKLSIYAIIEQEEIMVLFAIFHQHHTKDHMMPLIFT